MAAACGCGMRPRRAVVFDFDYSFVDDNTDTFVPKYLDPLLEDFIRANAAKMQWTQLMALTAERMHASGISRAAIEDALTHIPVHTHMITAMKTAAAGADGEVHIVSDANDVYISTILNHLGVADCVRSVVTNPAEFDASGKLIIRCPVNLCKGRVMEDLGLVRDGGDAAACSCLRVLYVGDGSGDFCPCTRLSRHDIVCAREDFPLLKKLTADVESIQCQIRPWKDGTDVLNAVREFMAAP